MASKYPGEIDTFTNPSAGDTQDDPPHAKQHTDANDAIVAIQTALGVEPYGQYGDVADRLGAIETGVSGALTGVTSTDGSITVDDTDPNAPDLSATYSRYGHGSPEGLVTAPAGTLYTDLDGTAGAWQWVKTTASGATGWSTRLSPAPINPLDLPHLEAAYSSRWPLGIGVDLPADGDPVSQWSDLSGHGRHLTQGDSGKQPLWRRAGDGKRPGVEFDGSATFLQTAPVAGAAEATIYVVAQMLDLPGSYGALVAQRDYAGSAGYVLYGDSPTSRVTGAYYVVGSASITVPTAGPSTSDVECLAMVLDGGGVEIYRDSILSGQQSGEYNPTSSAPISMGVFLNGITPNAWSTSLISDCLIYAAAHDAPTRQRVEAWLAARNGITLGA